MASDIALDNGIQSLVRSAALLKSICEILNKRSNQEPISVEELAGAMKTAIQSIPSLPSMPMATMPMASMPTPSAPLPSSLVSPFPNSMPGLAPSASVAPTFPVITNTPTIGKSTKTMGKVQLPESECCIHQITRGANKGKRCDNKKSPGSDYCTQHKNTIQAKKHTAQGTFPLPPSGPSLPIGFPGISSQPQVTQSKQGQPAPQSSIKAEMIQPGLYRETTYGIVMRSNNNEYVAIGIMPNPGDPNNIEPLTSKEIDYCRQIGLSYVDQIKRELNVTGQTIPPIEQQLPTLANLNLPSIKNSALPGIPFMVSSLAGGKDQHPDDPDEDESDDEGINDE